MPMWLEKREYYSRAERISDGVIHVAGIIFALTGAAVLITLAAVWRGEPWIILATAIYAATLIMMITASAAYHMTPWQDWKDVLRRVDHSAIYIKIAGTYTPFVALSGSAGLFLTGIWGAALAGTALRVFQPDRYYEGLALYLAMGWAGVVVGGDMLAGLHAPTIVLMLIGGAIYTLGVIVFLAERLHFHNTIWHAMVLIATGVFYAAILMEIATPAMTTAASSV